MCEWVSERGEDLKEMQRNTETQKARMDLALPEIMLLSTFRDFLPRVLKW